jgi:hypothetical protein
MSFNIQPSLKGREHVLTIKFDILEKSEVLNSQIGRSDFYSYKMVNIFKWRSALYISQVGHACMFFRLCTCFSDNLVEFHSRNKEVLKMTRRWTQTEDLKHLWWSPYQDDQNGYMECMIWSTDGEVMMVWKCSQNVKPEVPVWKTEWSSFYDSEPNMSRDLLHVWLKFSY